MRLTLIRSCTIEHSQLQCTVKTKIIENLARALELPLLVRSVSQVRFEGESSRRVPSSNSKPEIQDLLVSFSIISVLTVVQFYIYGTVDAPLVPWRSLI